MKECGAGADGAFPFLGYGDCHGMMLPMDQIGGGNVGPLVRSQAPFTPVMTPVKQVEQIAQVAAGTASATEEVSASVEEQTASMEEFTSTAQLLATFTVKLDEVLKKLNIN